jgi:putative colanic acid biosynthesis glycosyltransferase
MIYIFTVCFNNLDGLKKTYSSLKKISSQNYRWIVIDGNSTDGTVNWLKDLDEPCLDFISESDRGIYDAMNKAIRYLEKISAGYFIFMNSGDEFYDINVLDKIHNQNKNNVIIYGDYNDVYSDCKSTIKKAKNPNHLTKGMLTSHQAIFFSVNEYKNLFYDFNYKLSGDYDYIIRAFEIARLKQLSVVKLDAIICNFYLDGVSVLNRKQALKEDYQIRRKTLHLDFLSASMLFLAHLTHFYLKKKMPGFFNKRRL